MNPKAVRALKAVLPLVVLVLGAGAFRVFVLTRPEAQRSETRVDGVLVETVTVQVRPHAVALRAQGQVVPQRQLVLQPEVAGRVIWQGAELVPGGHFAANAPMLRVDPRDYRLALESRNAEVNRAQLELELERGRSSIAQAEWQSFGEVAEGAAGAEGRALALREPQVRTAQVGLRAAESSLERAELDLRRTQVRAPFNAMVVEEQVDVGQLVTQQSRLATLVGTDFFWVQVSVPVEALDDIRIASRDGGEGSPARVTQEVEGQRIERRGEVIRLLPDVDPVGGMARLLVEIDDPLGLEDQTPGSLPLLLGSFVTVEIDARPIERAIEIPRLALYEGGKVYVKGPDDRLQIRAVSIVWRQEESVLVGEGLADGDRVVVSRIGAPVDGLLLREPPPPASAPSARVTP